MICSLAFSYHCLTRGNIFTRTISDYLKNNKGYHLYSDVNKAALEKMKSMLIQEMDAWQAGYEDAVNIAESHVTDMDFSIWSSSFVNHAIHPIPYICNANKGFAQRHTVTLTSCDA